MPAAFRRVEPSARRRAFSVMRHGKKPEDVRLFPCSTMRHDAPGFRRPDTI